MVVIYMYTQSYYIFINSTFGKATSRYFKRLYGISKIVWIRLFCFMIIILEKQQRSPSRNEKYLVGGNI